MINGVTIKTKSQELAIPFAHVLLAYVTETAVARIAASPYGEEFWLCNGNELGLDAYKKQIPRMLRYRYVGRQPMAERVEQLRRYLTEQFQLSGLQITESVMEGPLLRFALVLDEMYVPLVLELTPADDAHVFARKEVFRLFMENDKTVTVSLYPMEQSIAYHLTCILAQLELLQDMEHYLWAYDILKKYPLEGRKVKDEITALCEKEHVRCEMQPFTMLQGYGDYAYMRKKWKVLLRRTKREEPAWEETQALICRFLEPIWQAVVEEQIFFGDWMPELGRFLD